MIKKNISCSFVVPVFLGVMIFSSQCILCQNKELFIPKLHNLFPYIARGYQDIASSSEKSTSFRLAKLPLFDNDDSKKTVNLVDKNIFVMAKLITAFNDSTVATEIEKDFFILFRKKYFESFLTTKALEDVFKYKSTTISHGKSGAMTLTAVFYENTITVANVGDNIALLCRKNKLTPLTTQNTQAFGFENTSNPIPDIKKIYISNDDTYLLLATPEIAWFPPEKVLFATQMCSTPGNVSDMLVREAIQQNKKFKDFEIIIIKIVSQESRAYRQILKNQALSMQKLFDDNKDTIINLNFFCKQFQTLCQDIYIVASKDSGSILNYQTNDLFYTILKLGYDNFASITNRVWFTNDVGMAIGSFCQLLSYIHSRDDMLAFFPNNQQLNIKFWLQEVERYLFLQYMNTKTTNINNTIFIL